MGLTVSREKGLKFNRQPSKKVIFYRQPTKMQCNMKCQNVSDLAISDDLHGLLAPEESLNWKNQFPCSQKHSLLKLQDLTCLHLKVFRNFVFERQRQPPNQNS